MVPRQPRHLLIPLFFALSLPLVAEPQLRVLVDEGAALRVVPGEGRLLLQDGQGRSLGAVESGLTLRASAAGIEGAGAPQEELWISPDSPAGSLWLQQRRYRGRLQLRLEQGRLQAINRLGVESYLPSVVGAEMPAQWPLEALRVQSVAARTYALRQLKPSAPFDLRATVSSQVYRGLESETDSTRQAVQSTRSLVLTYGNKLIDAVFFSSSGGFTENSGEIWPRQMPYLKSVPDFDQASPVYRWTKPLDGPTLLSSFREIGGVNTIEPLETTSTGRLKRVLVHGPTGDLRLEAGELRQRLGLRSTFVQFERSAPPTNPFDQVGEWLGLNPPLVAVGRGYGHGVGMSQWGAFGLAQQGESFGSILRHYYLGAKLEPYAPLANAVAPGPAWPKAPPNP
ncbi:MAG: SpoIID/LytB domain-containing protein [Synechococcus lacustris]